jgi:hypothetical protein
MWKTVWKLLAVKVAKSPPLYSVLVLKWHSITFFYRAADGFKKLRKNLAIFQDAYFVFEFVCFPPFITPFFEKFLFFFVGQNLKKSMFLFLQRR